MISGRVIGTYARYPRAAESPEAYFSEMYLRLVKVFPKIRKGKIYTNIWKLTPEKGEELRQRGILACKIMEGGVEHVMIYYCDFHVALDKNTLEEVLIGLRGFSLKWQSLNDEVIKLSIIADTFINEKLAV